MKSNQNIGNWTTFITNDDKNPQISVTGIFPSFGKNPAHQLIKIAQNENR